MNTLFRILFGCVAFGGLSLGAQPTPPPVVTEHQVYIPYDEFWKVFEQPNRGVFLPYKEFRALVDAARPQPQQNATAPEGVLISEISGSVQVKDTVVTGTAELVLDVMKKGWHEVPIALRGVTFTRATLDGAPARLQGASDKGHVLLLEHAEDKPGRHVLSLEFATRLLDIQDPATRGQGFEFTLPVVPVSRWNLNIPGEDTELTLDPRVALSRIAGATPATDTSVELFVASAPSLKVSWTPKVEGAQGMDPVIQSWLQHEVELKPDMVRTEVVMDLKIDRAPVERISLRVPAEERVVDLRSDKLKSWSLQADENGTQLVLLEFQEAVQGAQRVQLSFERYSLPETWQAPIVDVIGSVRQMGSLLLMVDAELRGEVMESKGLSRMDLKAPARIGGRKTPLDFGWSYRALPVALSMKFRAVTPEILVKTQSVVRMEALALEMDVVATFTLRRSGVFRLQLDIPEGYEVLNPRVITPELRLERHGVGEAQAGRRRIDFDFAGRVSGSAELQVTLRKEFREEALLSPTGTEVLFDIPLVRGAGEYVVSNEGDLAVGAAGYLSLRVAETQGLRELPWRELNLPGKVLEKMTPQLGFRHGQEALLLRVGATRRAPFTTVSQFLVLRAEAGVARFRSDLYLQVLHSGVRSLRVDVPTELAERIRILNADVRKRVLADAPDLEPGMTAWILEGPAEFIGDVQIPLEWDIPLSDVDVGVERELPIARIVPRGVDRALGQIVLRKAGAMDVLVRDHGAELTPIDPRHDLMRGLQIPDAALAFEFQRDWKLTATLVRYEPAVLKATSIERGLVRQVITRSGEVAVQALYQLRSTRQRLELRLPEGAGFEAQPLRINGRPVSLERGSDQHVYIPLTGLNADQAFLLELRYTLPAQSGDIHLPEFTEDPAAQKIYLAVHFPDNKVYLGQRGPWNPEFIWELATGFRLNPRGRRSEQSLWQWVSEGVNVDGSALDRLPTDGHFLLFSALRPETGASVLSLSFLSRRLFYALVLAGGIGLGLLLLRAAIATRILVSAFLIAGLLFSAVFLPSLSHALINDATAGGAALVLLLWAVYDVVLRLPRFRREMLQAQRHPIVEETTDEA